VSVDHRSIALSTVLDALTRGDLEIEGRLVDASNATLVAQCSVPGAAGPTEAVPVDSADEAPGRTTLRCVYKPVAGERPLWDFPDGTLGQREVAAYAVSAASGWDVVPPTVWREDGPFGPGMCQLWVETDLDASADSAADSAADIANTADAAAYTADSTDTGGIDTGDTDSAGSEAANAGGNLVDIVAPDNIAPGWLRILEALDHEGSPVTLVHADHPALRSMAVFDAVINNADRKGGHVLVAPDGAVRGVDHGVAFNVEHKLRTVLWGWSGEPIPESLLADLTALRVELDGALGATLQALLAPAEVTATRKRVDALLRRGAYPVPSGDMPSIPWPAF
jgi:hypothetical protein